LGIPYLGFIYFIGIFNHKQRVKMAYAYNRLTSWWLYTISGAKIITEGLENLEQKTNVLFVSNHRSMLDIPLMMLHIKKPIIFIGKDSIEHWPFIGWWLRAMDGLFIDRSSARAGLTTILTAIERIKQGESCIIYPEGTRSKTKDLLPFKQGSLKLASKTGVPVIPISVLGTADVFENNHINLKAETVYLSVGKPILLSELDKEDQAKSASYVQEIIQKMYNAQLQKQALSKKI
jgi:1-acyl-sn-glycerol-3-phosphate acyltransferase